MGMKREIEVEDRRVRPEKSEVMQLQSDTRLAQELFKWMPKYDLEDGTARDDRMVSKEPLPV